MVTSTRSTIRQKHASRIQEVKLVSGFKVKKLCTAKVTSKLRL